MLNKEILEVCKNAIKKDLGSLDDLSRELANSVANVYYRYFDHAFNLMKQSANNPGWIPKEMKRETDMRIGLKSFLEDSAKLKIDFESAPKFIKALREVGKNSKPGTYQYIVDFIIDCIKYNIKDAQKKTGLRRMIERRFSKTKPQEIPNLIDILNFD